MQIPVFVGCQTPLIPIAVPKHAKHVHGEDGLGGCPDFYPPASKDLMKKVKVCYFLQLSLKRF